MHWKKSAIAVALLALAIPGNSCGPFFTEFVFVNSSAPSDLESFLNGRIGVVQHGLQPRYLALAYRILSGPPLTTQEKSAVTEAHKAFLGQDQNVASDLQPPNKAALEWSSERAKVEPAAGAVPLHTSRAIPGQQWQDYSNCLQDAFANAARTLAARARDHPAEKAELAEWVRGQDAVFSNCDGSGQMPAEVSKPQWLASDRAYQTAAARFYRSEFGPAQDQFAQIAADPDSPHRSLAAFMVGRCLLRQATMSLPDKNDDNLMRQAATQFRKVMQAGGPYAGPAEELLNMVDLRINPSAAAARLGDRISHPDPRIVQHLIDLAYVGGYKWLQQQQDARKSDLVDWALTIQGFPIDPKKQDQVFQHAKDRWRQTGNVAWLVAALNNAQAPDEELSRAAESVPPTSPAWVTIAYCRLQMHPASAETRAQAEKVLRNLAARHESQDTLNLFAILARQKSESLEQYARLAPLEPVGADNGVDGFEQLPPASATPTGTIPSTMAGLPVNISGGKRLDSETAIVFNRHLPLKDLVPLVLNSTWPKQLRFELAMAVWTRAVLLDRPQEARRLIPAMIAGEPGLKPWLAAYDAATTPDDRRATSLLALMRFPSIRPYINAGAGREEGFVGYSGYRDNWWCVDMGGFDYSTGHNFSGAYPNPNKPPAVDLPSFVTPSMTSDSNQEQAELANIGDAPRYFGEQTLAWVKAHPKDPRNSELLGFALRAMRNGCNLEMSFELKREVFTILHTRYPQSEWAKKYPRIEDENP